MLAWNDVPERCKESFDEYSVEAIAKLARKHALDPEIRSLKDMIEETDISKFPENLQKRSSWEGEIADTIYEAMIDCVRYGIDCQKNYTQKHFHEMFTSCVKRV